jgi:hypothetical protein
MNRSNRSLACGLCHGAGGRGAVKEASTHAKTADVLVRRIFRGSTFITEARWLKGFNSGMDITIEGKTTWGEPFTLDVEIDGEQHFHKPFKNEPVYLQREVDKRKDRLAVAAGRRLLRLHYNDKRRWAKAIADAKERVYRNPTAAWVEKTKSYV